MSYAEYLPHPALRNYIESYWTLNIDGDGKSAIHRILPDGCTDIIFNRGDVIYGADLQKVMLSQASYLVGMMTTFKDTISNPGSSTLGIRFKAGGMTAFYPLAQYEITNLAVPYQDKKLAELIWVGNNLLYGIDQYFLEKLPIKPLAVSAIIADIYAARGKVRIPALTDKYNMSERKLERLFKQDVGLTIKGLTKLIRFTHTLSLIRDTGTQQSLTQIALNAGYYDQAHLCNEVKSYTGLTPAQL